MKIIDSASCCPKPTARHTKILRIMKLTMLFLTIFLLQVSAATKAQVTINEKNVPLQKALKTISQQTGYYFIYTDQDLKDAGKVTLQLSNATLEAALQQAFKDQPLEYQIEDKTVMVKKKTPSFLDNIKAALAAIDVHGRVVDEKGLPLPGVTIKLKDESQVILTDKDGYFTFKKISDKAVLVISYIGYLTKEVNVFPELGTIALEISNSKLDEVQVMAYGTTSRRLSTSDISTVKAEDIEKQPVDNPLLALQGRIPGLIVNQGSGIPGDIVTLQIRGKNSLNQSSDPLIIIDGLPYSNSIPSLNLFGSSALSFINPQDIESIDVLKDADGTAIYGSRGANGVIVITTKKGKIGAASTDVKFQQGAGVVGKKLDLLNTEQYISMRKNALINDGLIGDLSNPSNAPSYPDLMIWDQNKYTDWQKALIGGTASYTDAQGAISGGTVGVKYYIGGNFHRVTTVFPGDNSDQKGGAHMSITGTSANQKFKTTLTASYMADNNTLPAIDLTQIATHLAPNAPNPYNEDGTLNWEPDPISGFASWLNPYSYLKQQSNSSLHNFNSSGEISYKIAQQFEFKTTLGYNIINGNSIQTSPASSKDPKLVDLIANYARSTSFSTNDVANLSVEPQLVYNNSNGKNKINVLLGGSYQANTVKFNNTLGLGFINDVFLNNLGSADRVYYSGSKSQYRYNAVYFRATYNVDDKYILNVTGRRDGSSRFGSGRQFGNFGSVGAAWIFTNESVFKPLGEILSFGKLRASYGTAGNDGIGDYKYLQLYQNIGNYGGAGVYQSSGLYNSNYAWEVTKKLEIGLETGFFKDRILFSVNYFRNRSDNQLSNYPYPSIAGYGNLVTNLPAVIQNAGLELSVNTINIKTKKITWTSNFNFTTTSDKLLAYPDLQGSAFYQAEIGKSFTATHLYNYAGVNPATGTYQYRDANGTVVSDGATNVAPYYGQDVGMNTTPKFYGGLGNTISYNNFVIDFFFEFKKQTLLNYLSGFTYAGYFDSSGSSGNQPLEVFNNSWTKPGDVAQYQKFTTNYLQTWVESNNSNKYYTDASYIRLKNLSMSFNVPSNLTKKLGINNIKVFAQGQNLLTISKSKGFNSDFPSSNSLPPLKIYTLGIEVKL